MEPKILGTITVGNYKTIEELLAHVSDHNILINGYSRKMFDDEEMVLVPEATAIDLVIVSRSDLGFDKEAFLEDIIEEAISEGLEECPGETEAQMFIQMDLIPIDKGTSIIMKALRDKDGDPSVFRMDPDKKVIDSAWSVDRNELDDEDYIFILPRRPETAGV